MRNTDLAAARRNVVNADDVAAWTQTLADTATTIPEVRQWITTVLRRWIIRDYPTLPVVRTGRYWVAETERPGLSLFLAGRRDWSDLQVWHDRGDDLRWSQFPDLSYPEPLRAELQGAVDYLNSLRGTPRLRRLSRMAVPQVLEASRSWHARLAADPADRPDGDPTGEVVFHAYPDGYHWIDLVSEAALSREGRRMGHCVGNADYRTALAEGEIRILSLRRPDGQPCVTVEATLIPSGPQAGRWVVVQIKGRDNQPPPDAVHRPIFDLIARIGGLHPLGEDDLRDMGYRMVFRGPAQPPLYLPCGILDIPVWLTVTARIGHPRRDEETRTVIVNRHPLSLMEGYLSQAWGFSRFETDAVILAIHEAGFHEQHRRASAEVTDRLRSGERILGGLVSLQVRLAGPGKPDRERSPAGDAILLDR
jgi:hypothetical protein